MTNQRKRIIKLLAEGEFSICKICGTTKKQAIYRFRHEQYVDDYESPILEPVCRKCVYKEVFGSKRFNKKMKERVLDGNT